MFSCRRWSGIPSELSRRAALEVSPKKSKSRPTRKKARRRIPSWGFSLILHVCGGALLSLFLFRGDEPPGLLPGPLEIVVSGDGTQAQTLQPKGKLNQGQKLQTDSALPSEPSSPASVQSPSDLNATTGSATSSSIASAVGTNRATAYVDQLYSQIESHKKYPREALLRREQGRVEISFILQKNGQITDLTVSQGASPALDRAALDAVRKVTDLFPPPLELQAPLRLSVPLRFDLRR